MVDEDRWELDEGAALAEHLTAMRLLGGGTTYEAYLAFDEITYSPVVVKVIRPSLVADEFSLESLRREIDALTRVNHPAVVRMLRADVEAERPHVVLEHIEGPRLSSLIRRYGALQEQQYLPLAVDVAAALHYFRHLDVVHLDVKPSNIIMGAPARLIDMSVARHSAAAAEISQRIGTDAFMSPEQVVPGTPHSPAYASDVWGLGATLYEAVSGNRAFPTGSRSDPLAKRYPQLTGRTEPLPDKVPEPVRRIIEQCLAVDPAARPQPDEISEALAPVLAAQPQPKLAFKVRV